MIGHLCAFYLFLRKFNHLISAYQIQPVIQLAINNHQGCLRTPKTFQRLKEFLVPPVETQPILEYLYSP